MIIANNEKMIKNLDKMLVSKMAQVLINMSRLFRINKKSRLFRELEDVTFEKVCVHIEMVRILKVAHWARIAIFLWKKNCGKTINGLVINNDFFINYLRQAASTLSSRYLFDESECAQVKNRDGDSFDEPARIKAMDVKIALL